MIENTTRRSEVNSKTCPIDRFQRDRETERGRREEQCVNIGMGLGKKRKRERCSEVKKYIYENATMWGLSCHEGGDDWWLIKDGDQMDGSDLPTDIC